MRVFVTGASGFIGSHVARTLCPTHEVLAMARSARTAARSPRRGGELGLAELRVVGG